MFGKANIWSLNSLSFTINSKNHDLVLTAILDCQPHFYTINSFLSRYEESDSDEDSSNESDSDSQSGSEDSENGHGGNNKLNNVNNGDAGGNKDRYNGFDSRITLDVSKESKHDTCCNHSTDDLEILEEMKITNQ